LIDRLIEHFAGIEHFSCAEHFARAEHPVGNSPSLFAQPAYLKFDTDQKQEDH
jgi:hypothetical protein